MRRDVRMIQYGLGFFVLSFCLMLFTIPLAFALIASGALVFSLSFSKERYALTIVSATALLIFGLFEVFLRVIPSDAGPQYFRPHELLAGHQIDGGIINYKPNQRIENFRMPYGDLAAKSPIGTIMEPRSVNFYTDNLGFRNKKEYAGQRLVLFGDSFVVGNSSSQNDILSEVLTHEHQIPAYNAGYPGGIEEYITRVRFFKRTHGADFKAVVVVFEGNDFRCSTRHQRSLTNRVVSGAYKYVPKLVRGLETYRVFYGLTRRAYHAHFARDQVNETLSVLVEDYGKQDMGFYKKFVKRSKHPEVCAWEEHRRLFQSVANQIALVVYVPTKYRVYKSLPQEAGGEFPASASAKFMQDLAGELSLPYLDLTPSLVSASEALLEEGEYTFWRDDTHWNGTGIRVAADALAHLIRTKRLLQEP